MSIKPNILRMSPYTVPQEFNGIKINQNESPADLSLEIKEEIFQEMMSAQWNRYPPNHPEILIRQISEYTQCTVNGILVGNSSNELIQTVIYGCCDTDDSILTVSPTFSVYKLVASLMNINTHKVDLEEDFSFNTELILKKLKKTNNIKVVFLASPNNPTGTVLSIENIKRIVEATDALVVLDEAYFEFYNCSAQGLINDYSNLIILRTFSKALRGAGLRLGYLMAQPKMIEELKKIKLPFSVGIFQQIAGAVMLRKRDLLKPVIETTICERERVFNCLEKLPGVKPIPSKANFILFRSLQMNACNLFEELYKEGILVRFFESPELKDMIRVSIGLPQENSTFLEKLNTILV